MSIPPKITQEDVNRAMRRVGRVSTELGRARHELTELLNRAGREGLYNKTWTEACAAACAPTLGVK